MLRDYIAIGVCSTRELFAGRSWFFESFLGADVFTVSVFEADELLNEVFQGAVL